MKQLIGLLLVAAAVAQGAHRLVARGLDARLDIVGLDRVLQLAQAGRQFAQLEDQRVAGEEGIEFVGVAGTFRPARGYLQGALRAHPSPKEHDEFVQPHGRHSRSRR